MNGKQFHTISKLRIISRSLILINEFMESGLDEKRIIDISKNTTQDIPNVINEIMNNPKYKIV